MDRIYLLGYMGSGKSTIGRLLSKKINYSFIDLDSFIENRYHVKINDFFAKHGEDEFRKIESKILKEVSEFEHIVIALGGGTPCFFDNMDLINATGLSIYLKISEESLLSRLVLAKNNRPLIKDKTNEEIQTFISQTLEKRKPFYEQASIIIENDNEKDANEIVEEIFHSLGL